MFRRAALALTLVLSAFSSPARSAILPSLDNEHLYVSDAMAHAVLRFPLRNGIPAQQPDAEIHGFSGPRGVAIGPDHRLYVVDRGTRQLLVFDPMPGSKSKPIRVVSLSGRNGLGSVSVDPLGYVYIGWEAVCTTEGFYCGNVDIFSPFDKGLKLVSGIGLGGAGGGLSTAEVRSMAVSGSQLLAADLDIGPPQVYTHAPFAKSVYNLFCGGANDSGTAWGPSNVLYVTDLGATQPPSPPQVVVITKIVAGCPTFYTITSATIPLNNPLAIAADERHIYVTSGFNQQVGSALVFVFNPAVPGSQTPLAVLGGAGSKLNDPRGIAIGP